MHMKTTMYYDSGCPVCMRGVRHYRRVDWARRLAWSDLMANPDALADEGVSFADAMEHLHVRDRRGRLHAGGYAFLTLWDELPGYRRIAWLIRTLRLSAPFDRIYRRISRGRYLKRCEAGVCFVEGKTLE